MDYSYDYMYAVDDELATVIGVAYLVYCLVIMGIGIAGYVLNSLGLHTIAKRRGITKPWLAWIPIAHLWIIGSISDQFRYVTKGQIRNKRKVLLTLGITTIVIALAAYAMLIVSAIGVMDSAVTGGPAAAQGLGAIAMMLVMVLVTFGVSIAMMIIYYMAMYDLYTSVNPAYNVVFLVLGIIFQVTEPYFVFFNRKKDRGMPPRCENPAAPVAAMPRPVIQEPWENNPEA